MITHRVEIRLRIDNGSWSSPKVRKITLSIRLCGGFMTLSSYYFRRSRKSLLVPRPRFSHLCEGRTIRSEVGDVSERSMGTPKNTESAQFRSLSWLLGSRLVAGLYCFGISRLSSLTLRKHDRGFHAKMKRRSRIVLCSPLRPRIRGPRKILESVKSQILDHAPPHSPKPSLQLWNRKRLRRNSFQNPFSFVHYSIGRCF